MPSALELRFSDPVRGADVRATLEKADGTPITLEDPVGVDGVVSVAVPSGGDGTGSYVVDVGVVGSDGHAVQRSFAFVVGDGPLVDVTGQVVDGGAHIPVWLTAALLVSTVLVRVGTILLTGGLVMSILWRDVLADPRAIPVLLGAAAATLIGSFARAALQNLERSYAEGQAAMTDLDPSGTPFSRLLCLGGVVAVLWGWSLVKVGRTSPATSSGSRWLNIALVSAAFCFVAAAGTSHAAKDGLLLALSVVHGTSISAWLGGLAALYAGVRSVGPAPSSAWDGFHHLASWTVVSAILSGSALALLLTDGGQGARAAYLVWLGVKIGAVLALVAVAAVSARRTRSRNRVTDGAGSTIESDQRQLSAIRAELVVGALTIAVAAVLASVSPT